MVARGRPTPQPDAGERPFFRDRTPEEVRRADINPYFLEHRDYGPPLVTAETAWTFRGRWDECFAHKAPLHVEIGSGNGFFLAAFASLHPEFNVLGIEIRYKRTVLCAKKIDRAGADNARIARYHAAFLDDLFEDASIAGLYINHPDPWPKERHEKNRLISRWFLEDLSRLLQDGAVIRLKSDHMPNITRLQEVLTHGPQGEPLPPLPFDVTGKSLDVTRGEAPWPDDIETNYQSKFRKRGEPVHAIELVRRAR